MGEPNGVTVSNGPATVRANCAWPVGVKTVPPPEPASDREWADVF